MASIGFVVYGYVVIGFVWIYAAQTERIPSDADVARYARTGHGPWNHVSDLNEILGQGMIAPIIAFILAIASLVMRRKAKVAVLTGACVFSALMFLYTHFWLID